MNEPEIKECYTCSKKFKEGDEIFNVYYGLICKSCRDYDLFVLPPKKEEPDAEH